MAKQKKSLLGRQKLLLALLQAWGGCLSRIELQKYLFLFTKICEKNKSYDFVPYNFGCFSFQSDADLRYLTQAGVILELDGVDENKKIWQIAEDTGDYISALSASSRDKVIQFAEEFKSLKGDALIRYVYKTDPYYAINSHIASKIMNPAEQADIEKARPCDESYRFFTIGYEGHSFDHYLNRLIKNNVKLLCDVRKNPLSRKYGFSKLTLSNTLGKLGIDYDHLPELGIASEKRQALATQSDYDKLFDDYEKTIIASNKKAIDKLLKSFLDKKRVAITCFEAEACRCHRSRIAQALSRHPSWKDEIYKIVPI